MRALVRGLAGLTWLAGASCNPSAAPTASNTLAPSPPNLPIAGASAESAFAADPPALDIRPYPPARWRLASDEQLASVVLWLSHILVRHDQVTSFRTSFFPNGWRFDQPLSTRSRAEAWRLASDLGQAARAQPERFADLARAWSEDPATCDEGGSLGGIGALDLRFWPEVLDALATVGAGQVTGPVETEHGVHVFLRRAPPPEQQLDGSRIVIGYDDAPWLQLLERGPRPRRSREQARALAERISARARSAPSEFSDLVRRHSEHRDAARAGDFGSWSSREPTPLRRELERLATLAVGEVSRPLDTFIGFQVLQRTANTAQTSYAMSALQLAFDRTHAAEDGHSRSQQHARARALAQLLAREPQRFAEFQALHCCTGVSPVIARRDSPALEAALARLEPGDVFGEPIEIGDSLFLVVKREPLEALPPAEPPRVELPAPARPELSKFLNMSPDLADDLRQIAELTRTELALPEPLARELMRAHELAANRESASLVAWTRAIDGLMQELEALLGPDDYARYRVLFDSYVEAVLLETPLPSHTRAVRRG